MFLYPISEDIYLKQLELIDAERMYPLIEESRVDLQKWLPWVKESRNVQDTEKFISYALEEYEKNKCLHAVIIYQDQLVGLIGLNQVHPLHRFASIGYWLGSQYQGKGIMTQACAVFVRYAFEELNMNRVEIKAATGNLKSQAIPERLGFTREGCIRQTEWLYDHFVDHYVFGLLKEEYQKIKANFPGEKYISQG